MVSLNKISLSQWQEQNLEYLRYEYDLKPSDKVIDIGSYRREWTDTIIKKFGCNVECFDALDNKAAWKENGKINMGGQYYYTSYFDNSNINLFGCVDIKPYLSEETALVKINIEGMEYELIRYIIEQGLIKNIKDLQVQFHVVDELNTDKIYRELAEELSKTHSLTWQYKFCWESWSRIC